MALFTSPSFGVTRASVLSVKIVSVAGLSLFLAHCGNNGGPASRYNSQLGVSSSPRVVADGEPVPKGGGVYRVGRPYTVGGKTYVPTENQSAQMGLASWYGRDFHGRLTANGEVFDQSSISAAHRTMPMPSYARVTNMTNGHSIIVRVNDRGPYHSNRVMDLSSRAAHLLDFKRSGTARVKVEYVGRASVDGSDDRRLEATLRTNGDKAPLPNGANIMVASAKPDFVPAQEVETPAVVANVASVAPLSGGMPLPLDRPFELGGGREDGPRVNTPAMAAARPAPVATYAVASAPAPVAPAPRPSVSQTSATSSTFVMPAPRAQALPPSALGFSGGRGGLY